MRPPLPMGAHRKLDVSTDHWIPCVHGPAERQSDPPLPGFQRSFWRLPRGFCSTADAFLRCLNELGVDRKRYFVAHQHAAAFKRSVPGEAEVLAIDLRRRRNADAQIAPWVLARRAQAFDGKGYRPGHPADGQVALNLEFPSPGRFYGRGFE